MSAKLPENAFETYVALGPARSYQALAQKLGVDKRTVVRRASEGKWAERLSRIQREANEKMDRKIADSMQAVRERQLKEARFVQGFAIKAMQSLPPDKAVKAAMALAIGWKQELLLLGDPTERNETIPEFLRAAHERWLIKHESPAAAQPASEPAGSDTAPVPEPDPECEE